MSAVCLPGTVLPCDTSPDGAFSRFRAMIAATDGLSLGQVCSLTGLEPSTVQNWVKRGFVAHPVRKRYYERQFARILLISLLRDSMRIEQIAAMLSLVNGDVEDERDDTVSESRLYEYLCTAVLTCESIDSVTLGERITAVTADYAAAFPAWHPRLCAALRTMATAYFSGRLKAETDRHFAELQALAASSEEV